MSHTISRRERRVMIGGAVMVTATFLAAHAVPAWRDWESYLTRRAEQRLIQATRAEQAVRELDAATDSLARLRELLAAIDTAVLHGANPSAAAANLAAQVTDAALNANVQVNTVRLNTDSVQSTRFARVSVRLDATADIGGVTALIATLAQQTGVAVREITITQPDPAPISDLPETLRIELRVDALAAVTRRDESS